MERDAIDDEGRKQGDGQRHETIRQQQNPNDQVRHCDQLGHVTGLHERAQECRRALRERRGWWEEVQKSVEPEY